MIEKPRPDLLTLPTIFSDVSVLCNRLFNLSKQYKPDGLPNFKLRDLKKVKTVTNLADIKYEKNLHHFVFFVRNIIRDVSRADYLYRLFALKLWACYSLIFDMKSIRHERRRNFGQDRQLIS